MLPVVTTGRVILVVRLHDRNPAMSLPAEDFGSSLTGLGSTESAPHYDWAVG